VRLSSIKRYKRTIRVGSKVIYWSLRYIAISRASNLHAVVIKLKNLYEYKDCKVVQLIDNTNHWTSSAGAL